MTNAEFKNEFRINYDAASNGAPALNNYEMSVFLTQAVRDIIDELYPAFEFSEYNKRALSPLVKEEQLALTTGSDYFTNFKVFEASLPSDSYYILQENVKLIGQKVNVVEVISEDLDHINKSLKNPFREPSPKRVLRTQIGNKKVRLYSYQDISQYKIKYLKQYKPIILSDFDTDPDLLGTETIDGKNKITTTDLPTFLHHKIIDRAVVLAIKALRENNLKTQIEV